MTCLAVDNMSQAHNANSPNLSRKWLSDVVRNYCSINFHLSKLSNAKFSILYHISLVRDWKRKLKLITLGSERVKLAHWLLSFLQLEIRCSQLLPHSCWSSSNCVVTWNVRNVTCKTKTSKIWLWNRNYKRAKAVPPPWSTKTWCAKSSGSIDFVWRHENLTSTLYIKESCYFHIF